MDSVNIVFTGIDQVEARREPVRDAGPDEVIVQASKTLISTGTECICLGSLFEPGSHWADWVRYPFSPGYSLVGRVVATGSEISSVHVGDRVGTRTPHRQYTVTKATNLHRIPDEVGDEEATWFGLASIVQMGVRRAEQALGDSVVVVGVGLLGQLAVQYARLQGARQVIAVDPAEMRVEMAKAHGATHGLVAPVQEVREEVLKLTDGGADVVYEVTGNWEVLPYALPLARRLGKLQLLGDTGYPSRQHLTRDIIMRGIRIIGAHDNMPPHVATEYAPWTHARQIQLFFTYLARGDLRFADEVTHRYAPANAPEAYRVLREERPSAMGVIFDFTQI